MGRPRQISDEQLLAIARAAFLEHGPSLSTVELARLVGLSQAALFHRFGTKKALMLRALKVPAVAPFVAQLERGPDERDLREQLTELSFAVAHHFDLYVPCSTVLRAAGLDSLGGMTEHSPPPPVRSQRALASWLQAAMDSRRLRQLDPEATAILLLGALQARALLRHLFPKQITGVDQGRFIDNLVEVILGGHRSP